MVSLKGGGLISTCFGSERECSECCGKQSGLTSRSVKISCLVLQTPVVDWPHASPDADVDSLKQRIPERVHRGRNKRIGLTAARGSSAQSAVRSTSWIRSPSDSWQGLAGRGIWQSSDSSTWNSRLGGGGGGGMGPKSVVFRPGRQSNGFLLNERA